MAGKRMTQTEIVGHMADSTGLTKAQAKDFFNSLSDLAKKEVKKNKTGFLYRNHIRIQ